MPGDLEVPIVKTESQILTSSSSSPNFDGAEQREQGNDVETLTATHTQEETEITRNIFDLMDKIFGLEQQVDEQKKD